MLGSIGSPTGRAGTPRLTGTPAAPTSAAVAGVLIVTSEAGRTGRISCRTAYGPSPRNAS